jgi:hypothetical protein
VIQAKGNRGSWFAEVDGERLPCVHRYWLTDGRYEDPGCMPKVGKWPRFIRAIRDGQRVLMTESKVEVRPDRKSGRAFSRTAYLYVADVENVEADEQSLRFKLKAEQ